MEIINWLIEFFKRDEFTAFSNVSSVVGLIVSIIVFFRIQKFERNYFDRFRVPDLILKIEAHAFRLANNLNDYPNFIVDIKLELARSKVNLESLQEKMKGRTKKSIKLILNQIQRYSESNEQLNQLSAIKSWLYRLGLYRLRKAGQEELKSDRKRDTVYGIYESMLALTEEVSNVQKDRELD